MNVKPSKIKLGVLNMTIVLDQPRSKRHLEREMKYSTHKVQEFPFTPNNHTTLQQQFFTAHKGLTPYLRNRNDSFRYFRNQQQPLREALQQTARLPSRSNKMVLEGRQDRYREEEAKRSANLQLDSSFNLRQTRKQIKNSVNIKHEQVQSDERIIIVDLKSNPQENFKSIFTVNPVKTSQRMRIKLPNQRAKPSKAPPFSHPLSRRQYRIKSNNETEQKEGKRIRPWSTSKNHDSKLNSYEVDLFAGEDPELVRTN